MTGCIFRAENVPALTAKVRERLPSLRQGLNGVDHMIQLLASLPNRSHIDQTTLYEIAREKSQRKAELVKRNDPDLVKEVTRLAFKTCDDTKPVQLLCVLDGVDLPTASAVLGWMFDDRWPVIDRRGWKTLFYSDVVTTHASGTQLGWPQWQAYLSAVRRLQADFTDEDFSPQRVDRLLYALADPAFGIVPPEK